MTPRAWSFIVVLAFALALAHTACAATSEIALPTWPQVFNLAPNQTKGFAFPMNAAGRIAVDLTWTGVPLTVTLTDFGGASLKPGTHVEGGTAKLTFTLTAAQAKANPVCMILLKADNKPGPPAKPNQPPMPAASGKISVTYPAVDLAAFRVKLQPLLAQRAAILAKPRLKFDPKTLLAAAQSRADAFNKAQLAPLQTQQQTLLAQSKLATTAALTALTSSTASLAPVTQAHSGKSIWAAVALRPKRLGALATAGIKTPSGKLLKPLAGVVTHYDKPTLVSTDPGQGSPGAEVVLEVGGISDDPASLKVLFTVQSTLPAQEAKIISTSISGPEVYIVASVPNPAAPDPTHPLRDYAGTVVVQGPSGSTNSLPFHFNPILLPSITGTRLAGASACPGDTLLVDGTNLVAGTKAIFIYPWDPQKEVPATNASSPASTATLLPTRIPTHLQPARFKARMFVRYHYATTYLQFDVDSNEVDVTLDAESPTLTAVNPNSASAEASVSLSGQGFCDKSGEVHFVNSHGDHTGTIVSWSDTQIVASVPGESGVSAPETGQVWVKLANGGKTSSSALKYVALLFRQPLDMNACLDSWNALFIKNSDMDTSGYGSDGTITGDHWNRFWHYDSGTDAYFWASDVALPGLTPKLKRLLNGWKVVNIDFHTVTSAPLADCGLDGSHLNSDDPYLAIGWHTVCGIQDGMVEAMYHIVVTIEGPKGIPYH